MEFVGLMSSADEILFRLSTDCWIQLAALEFIFVC